MSLDVYLDTGVCPTCGHSERLYNGNITHNLNEMAKEAGLYDFLWRADEIGITKASELVKPLETGLTKLLEEPKRFRKFNPSNGWGTYETLCLFVSEYLAACKEHPEAIVSIWA